MKCGEERCFGSMNDMKRVCEHLTVDELLCQLAEEAAELGKAAMKLRRARTGDNPTPVTREQVERNLVEEVFDLEMVLTAIGFYEDYGCQCPERKFHFNRKFARWAGRLENGK